MRCPPAREPRGAWIDQLHRLWGETWVPSLSLGTRARELDERRFELDAVQLGILDGLLDNDRVLVQGGAGSGKTLLAAEAARRHVALGKKVLVLCFTKPLGKWLATRLGPDGVEVQTVSGFAKGVVDTAEAAAAPDDGTDSEYWKEVLLRAAELCERRWDTVIVDEAQDLQEEAWLLVQELADGRRLWAFHDPGQSFWADRRPPAQLFGMTFKLPRGQRCPPGVEALATRFAGAPADEKVIAEAKAAGTLAFVVAPSATLGRGQDRRGGRTPALERPRARRHRDRVAPGPYRPRRRSSPGSGLAGTPSWARTTRRWRTGSSRTPSCAGRGSSARRSSSPTCRRGSSRSSASALYVALTRSLVCARLVGTREQQARYGF